MNVRFAPKTEIPALRAVVFFVIFICIAASANSLRLAFLGDFVTALIGLAIWIPLAVGLWKLKKMARGATILMLWYVVIIVPLGMINPFAAINDYGPNPPNVWSLAAWIYPCVVIALCVLHILGKYKKEFT